VGRAINHVDFSHTYYTITARTTLFLFFESEPQPPNIMNTASLPELESYCDRLLLAFPHLSSEKRQELVDKIKTITNNLPNFTFNPKQARRIRLDLDLTLQSCVEKHFQGQFCPATLIGWENGKRLPNPKKANGKAYLNWLRQNGYGY